MIAYTVRRLLLMIPTLLGIMILNVVIIQAAPGGPIDVMIARIKGQASEATARLGGSNHGGVSIHLVSSNPAVLVLAESR